MMYIPRSILIALSLLLLFNSQLYCVVEFPEPIIPQPKEIHWEKIKSSPYTMVIKSKRYGEFNFTKEAEESLNEYRRLCKKMGLRKEIIDEVDITKGERFIEVNCKRPLFRINIRPGRRLRSIELNYPHKDYLIKLVLGPKDNYKPLIAEWITKYSMEIPAVGLVNKKNEIVDLIFPPSENILPLSIGIEKICDYNKENLDLMEELKKPFLSPDKKDDIIQRIIANVIYHPLGKFCLGKKNDKIMILAEVLSQKVLLPLDCINIPLNSLIKENSLKKLFPREEISNLSDKRIMELIYKRTLNYPKDEFMIIAEFLLRKDWHVITTPNTCYWTDYFMNYIEIKSKKMEIKFKIPIHLHPLYHMEWLLDTPERYWLTELQVHLIPSGKDLEFFKTRYPEDKIFIILGKDPYSEELDWAIYDDINLVEKKMQNLEVSGLDKNRIKITLENIKDTRGIVYRYYIKKESRLIIDELIDSLLVLNKRQMTLSLKIEDYKKEYPWRLLNTAFFIPVLNEELEDKGWRVVSNKKEILGYNVNNNEFYYKKGTARMDLFLFIIFKLCYIDAKDLPSGLNKEAKIIEYLKDICSQLDYLSIKYYHFEGFSNHLEYLSSIIRHNVWEREKLILIAKEQVNNGRIYLNKYNLGYYKGGLEEEIRVIAEISFPKEIRILELEDIVRALSRKHNIKNIEEFNMEFEKQLVLGILALF